MIYIYAYSNHKESLDRVRRMVVLYRRLESNGESVTMLTNNFRAVDIAKKLGAGECTTIETIMDIDFIAKDGDKIVIDSDEDDRGKLEVYVDMFESVSIVPSDCDYTSRFGEEILDISNFVDESYRDFVDKVKEDRVLLFWGDSDADKYILKNKEKFAGKGMELLLGEYFYMGYEDALRDTFVKIHESQEYKELISISKKLITISIQAAINSSLAGNEATYVDMNGSLPKCQRSLLSAYGVKIVNNEEIF